MTCQIPDCNRKSYKEKDVCGHHYLLIEESLEKKLYYDSKGRRNSVSIEEALLFIKNKEQFHTKDFADEMKVSYPTALKYLKKFQNYNVIEKKDRAIWSG